MFGWLRFTHSGCFVCKIDFAVDLVICNRDSIVCLTRFIVLRAVFVGFCSLWPMVVMK